MQLGMGSARSLQGRRQGSGQALPSSPQSQASGRDQVSTGHSAWQRPTVLATVATDILLLLNRGASQSLHPCPPQEPRAEEPMHGAAGASDTEAQLVSHHGRPGSSFSWPAFPIPSLPPETPQCSLPFPRMGTRPSCPSVPQADKDSGGVAWPASSSPVRGSKCTGGTYLCPSGK